MVVLPLLLLNRHDILQSLTEILQVQVEILLVKGELVDLFSEDCDISITEVLL